jgi:hypothetical protein
MQPGIMYLAPSVMSGDCIARLILLGTNRGKYVNLPILILHVTAGSAALLAGAAALSFRKGSRLHARAGTIFFGAMLVMTTAGALLAALRAEWGTMFIGTLTFYLVATSWVTARNRAGAAGRFEALTLPVPLLCASAFITLGLLAANHRHPDSLPSAAHFSFAGLAILAAALDLNFLLRRRISGVQRIARHLWRMSAALLIAAFSFFLGQQKVMPLAWHGSPLLFIPPFAVLGAMIFWLFRVRFAKAFRLYAPRTEAGRRASLTV